jgi:hypothetical protein
LPPTIIWLQAEVPRTRLANAGAIEFSRNLWTFRWLIVRQSWVYLPVEVQCKSTVRKGVNDFLVVLSKVDGILARE